MLYPFSQVHTVFEHLRKIQSSILGKTIIEIVYLSPRPEIKQNWFISYSLFDR